MQHTNEETTTQTTSVGPAPAEPVDWNALKRSMGPAAYHERRAKKQRSETVTWQTFKRLEEKHRSEHYKKLIPRGWQHRTQNYENISEFIFKEMQKPSTQISFEVKENGVCTLIFLELLSDDGTTLRFRVSSIEGKQGPWDASGTDMGDLRTSGFHLIVQSLLNNCDFALPKAFFPDGVPPGLLVQAELVYGCKTSHMTVTQKIFQIKNAKNAQERLKLLEPFVLKIFGVSIYRKAETILEDNSTVHILPLSMVDRILTHWNDNVTYTSCGLSLKLHRVPRVFFMGELTPQQMDAFREFYAEHCGTGAGNSEEGFILKKWSECGVEGVPPDLTMWKIKRIYKNNEAYLFSLSANNAVLLLMPHGATKDSLPLGLICAPPLQPSEKPLHGREITATFFEFVTDHKRGDFGVVPTGGCKWDAVEAFLRVYKDLVKKYPECLHTVETGKEEFGYISVKYTTVADDPNAEPCTCLVRASYARDFQIMVLDMNFALNDEYTGSPFVFLYGANQFVPQKNSDKGMLYVPDTPVFAGILTPEHLEEDAATLEDEFKELDDPTTDLSFIQKCKFARPFPKLEKDSDAWDPVKYNAFIEANITHLTPGMSPDTIKPPCVLHKYYQVVRRAMAEKHGALPSAKYTVPVLKTTEAKAFFQARSWWGTDFDLIAMCKTSRAQRAREMVTLLEKNKGGGTLTEVEEEKLLDFLKSVQKNWTQKLSSLPKIASASAKIPTPVPETPTPVLETPTPVPETPAPVLETPAPVPETPSPTIENLEIGDSEPIEISRNSLLASRMWVEYLTGKKMAPILLYAYELEEDKETIPLMIQALADMEESRKREGDGGDSADEPARKKFKAD